jgi:hypothetical protein
MRTTRDGEILKPSTHAAYKWCYVAYWLAVVRWSAGTMN